MKFAYLALLLFFTKNLVAQFQIGHTSITFLDPARGNRAILTEIYYPADVAGDNMPVAAGAFPVVNFGHGFVMAWSAYQNIWEALAPEGFIVCLPRTEGGFSPNHTEFAKDLAFLCTAMTMQNGLSTSLFFNHVDGGFAVFGHSMGGGSAILARQYNVSQIKLVGGLAPANTTPSAITAAASIGVPSLIIGGSYDCIAPVATHAKPIWDALLPTLCKFYINITGASHCNFANANTNCTLGEVASGCANPPISAIQQQSLTRDIMLPWLKYFLKDDQDAWLDLVPFLDAANGFTKLQMCNSTATIAEEAGDYPMKILGNPVSGELNIETTGLETARFEIFDLPGRRVLTVCSTDEKRMTLDVSGLPSGIFFVRAFDKKGQITWNSRFLKQ